LSLTGFKDTPKSTPFYTLLPGKIIFSSCLALNPVTGSKAVLLPDLGSLIPIQVSFLPKQEFWLRGKFGGPARFNFIFRGCKKVIKGAV